MEPSAPSVQAMIDCETRTFSAFVDRAAARVEAADPADPMTPYRPLNLARMKRITATYTPSDELRRAIATVQQPRTWLVITEDWCGDSAQTLPLLAAIAALNPLIDFTIIDRDTNIDIMDKYLTNGSRSIPILVARDAQGKDLWTWGPRPDAMLSLIELWKTAGRPKEEWYTELHTWYANDHGVSTEADIIKRLATEQPTA
ncbi:MAG: thioredoxin family protein [Candidatus Kapabacteria bacterium]|nr:thioredoxin family protein [Candidatus Kapabacteria bacterium]